MFLRLGDFDGDRWRGGFIVSGNIQWVHRERRRHHRRQEQLGRSVSLGWGQQLQLDRGRNDRCRRQLDHGRVEQQGRHIDRGCGRDLENRRNRRNRRWRIRGDRRRGCRYS
jgi:hypothetical protein